VLFPDVHVLENIEGIVYFVTPIVGKRIVLNWSLLKTAFIYRNYICLSRPHSSIFKKHKVSKKMMSLVVESFYGGI